MFRKAYRGFTLMELMVTMGLIAILAVVVVVSITGAVSSGRRTLTAHDVQQVGLQMDLYNAQHPGRKYPTIDGKLPSHAFSEQAVTQDMLKEISWAASFTNPGASVTRAFVPDFVKEKPLGAEKSIRIPAGASAEGLTFAEEVNFTDFWVLDSNGKLHFLAGASGAGTVVAPSPTPPPSPPSLTPTGSPPNGI